MGIIKTVGSVMALATSAKTAMRAASALSVVGGLVGKKAGQSLINAFKGAPALPRPAEGEGAETGLARRMDSLVPKPVRPAIGVLAVTAAGALVARKVLIVARRRRSERMEAVQEEFVVPVNDADGFAQPSVVVPAMSPYEELVQLKALLDMDAITQEDYDLKKMQLLGL